MAKILFLLVVRLLAASPSSSGDCGKVDLRPQLPASSQQGSTNWCFAYTAATLASFKLKTPISAADIAVNYTDNPGETVAREISQAGEQDYNLLGGNPAEALRRSSPEGFCRERDFSSENRDNGIQQFEDNLEQASSLRAKRDSAGLEKNPVCPNGSAIAQTVFPGLNICDEILVRENATRRNAIRKLRNVACHDRVKPATPFEIVDDRCEDLKVCLNDHGDYQRKLIETIDQQLSAGNLPAISFSPSAYKVYIRGARHAAVIVGRKLTSSGECRYIVRDSDSSKLCPMINQAYEKGQMKPGGPICREGHIELRREDLQKYIAGITYIR